MSYGGSGVLINCIGLAILLRIDYETGIDARRPRMRACFGEANFAKQSKGAAATGRSQNAIMRGGRA